FADRVRVRPFRVPSAPGNLTGSVVSLDANAPTDGGRHPALGTIDLTWLGAAPDPDTSYVVEAGSSAGQSDVAIVDTHSAVPGLRLTGVSSGLYYVRVRTRDAGGTSAPSNEVAVRVGAACAAIPSPPRQLAASVNGSSVTLTWQAPGTSN